MDGEEEKESLTLQLPADLVNRLRDAVQSTPGLTLEALVEEALREALDKLEEGRAKPGPAEPLAPPDDLRPPAKPLSPALKPFVLPVEASRLRPFQLFAGLRDEELSQIAEKCEEVTVPSGTVIIQQGRVGKEVYLLEQGSVGIYRGETETSQFLAVLHAPTEFGEMAIVTPERIRTASAKAVSNLYLLTIQIDSFLSFLQRFPLLKNNLRRLIAERT